MPTYEYFCNNCQGHFEYFQMMTEAPKTKCEKCGGRLNRLLGSGAGLVFKGSGFYITDYRSSGNGDGKSKAADGGASSSAGANAASAEGSSASPASSSTAAATSSSASSSSATSGS
jgi:putative FmdB family regulatory protein